MAKNVFGIPAWIVFLLLLAILVIPSGYFVYKSYDQLDDILVQISDRPLQTNQDPTEYLEQLSDGLDTNARPMIFLEVLAMANREGRAAAGLATRTWMRFMSLIFGVILIAIGAAFVLGHITTVPSKASVGFSDFRISIASSSPGLFLVAFGIVLIAIPNLSSQVISVSDASIYAGGPGGTTSTEYAMDKKEAVERIMTRLKELQHNNED